MHLHPCLIVLVYFISFLYVFSVLYCISHAMKSFTTKERGGGKEGGREKEGEGERNLVEMIASF